MGCGFWGMSKGKAAAERVMLNIGAPPVALGLGDGVGQRKLAALPMCHSKGFHPFAFLYINIGKLSHGKGRITRVGDREPSAGSVLWHRLQPCVCKARP